MISSGKQTKLSLFFCFCLKSDCVSLPRMQYWTTLNSKDWSCLSSELWCQCEQNTKYVTVSIKCAEHFSGKQAIGKQAIGPVDSDGCIRVQHFTEVMQLWSYWFRAPKLVWEQSTVVVVSGCSTFDLTESGHWNWEYGRSKDIVYINFVTCYLVQQPNTDDYGDSFLCFCFSFLRQVAKGKSH